MYGNQKGDWSAMKPTFSGIGQPWVANLPVGARLPRLYISCSHSGVFILGGADINRQG